MRNNASQITEVSNTLCSENPGIAVKNQRR